MTEYLQHQTQPSFLLKVNVDSIQSIQTLSDEFGLKTVIETLSLAEADSLRPDWRADFVPSSQETFRARLNTVFRADRSFLGVDHG